MNQAKGVWIRFDFDYAFLTGNGRASGMDLAKSLVNRLTFRAARFFGMADFANAFPIALTAVKYAFLASSTFGFFFLAAKRPKAFLRAVLLLLKVMRFLACRDLACSALLADWRVFAILLAPSTPTGFR